MATFVKQILLIFPNFDQSSKNLKINRTPKSQNASHDFSAAKYGQFASFLYGHLSAVVLISAAIIPAMETCVLVRFRELARSEHLLQRVCVCAWSTLIRIIGILQFAFCPRFVWLFSLSLSASLPLFLGGLFFYLFQNGFYTFIWCMLFSNAKRRLFGHMFGALSFMRCFENS